MAESLEAASRQFEAAMLRQVLSAARVDRTFHSPEPCETSDDPGDDSIEPNAQSIFGNLVVGALADAVAQTDGLGLARCIARSLNAKS